MLGFSYPLCNIILKIFRIILDVVEEAAKELEEGMTVIMEVKFTLYEEAKELQINRKKVNFLFFQQEKMLEIESNVLKIMQTFSLCCSD